MGKKSKGLQGGAWGNRHSPSLDELLGSISEGRDNPMKGGGPQGQSLTDSERASILSALTEAMHQKHKTALAEAIALRQISDKHLIDWRGITSSREGMAAFQSHFRQLKQVTNPKILASQLGDFIGERRA